MATSAEHDHKAAIYAIGVERVAALSKLSDAHGFYRLASHMGLLTLTGIMVLATDG